MWTRYRSRTGRAREKNEKSDGFTLPPIPDQSKFSTQDPKIRSQTEHGTQRLQQLFFSSNLQDRGHRVRKAQKKKPDLLQTVSHAKLSEETAQEIQARLIHHLQLRYLEGHGQGAISEGREGLTLNKRVSLKEQGLRTLNEVEEKEPTLSKSPKLLQSLAALEETDQLEEEQDNKGDQEVTSWTLNGTNPQKSSSKDSVLGPNEPNYSHFCEATDSCLKCFTKSGTKDMTSKQRRFMVYICGGYKDSVVERQALMENVYPRLYLHCKQRGCDFKMVDLRLGVGDPLCQKHDTVELHMDMLRQCQETEGPDLFLFLGQKHELLTLPFSISQHAFESILSVMKRDQKNLSKRQTTDEVAASDSQSRVATASGDGSFALNSSLGGRDTAESLAVLSEGSVSQNSLSDTEEVRLTRSWMDYDRDLTLLQMWYKLDENSVPAEYQLLPVSIHHPDFLSKDGERRQQARREWRSSSLQLWGVLYRSGLKALGEEATFQLLRTVLERELEEGLSAMSPPEDFCHCYKRIIPDLQFNLRSEHTPQFIDLLKGRPEINQKVHSSHQRFIHNLHKKLRHTNIYENNVGWGRKGFSPKHNRSHLFYIERLCSHFTRTVTTALNRSIEVHIAKESIDVKRQRAVGRGMLEEITRHIQHGQKLQKKHVFRQDVLTEVRRAIVETPETPVLLLGEVGWGKSTTLALVAHLVPTWIQGNVQVLLCFIGLTAESRNVRLVLQSLCMQLAQIYCRHTEISESLSELSSELYALLGLVREEQPVVIVLDGLDELSEEHNADLSWLHNPLPPHVCLILSASCLSACAVDLQKRTKPHVVSLPPLTPEEVSQALLHRLAVESHRLQPQQWDILYQACMSCPSPLYLEAAYSETRDWRSFTPQASLTLPVELPKLYQTVLSRLEREHGEQLVRRVASLISLGRFGVTDDELLELVLRDTRVLREVESQCHLTSASFDRPPKLPSVLWARLRRDLTCHVMEVESDGTWVQRWTHAAFGAVVVQRYLQTDDSKVLIHADFADYYRGNLNTRQSDVFQPLAWVLDEDQENGTKSYVFNLRKLHGLPYHLIHSGQILPLLTECIFNYEFLLHKAWGLSIVHVEEDLKAAVIPDKELLDVVVLSQALFLSQHHLMQDPCQIASQLAGRLTHIAAEDKPVAPGDPRIYSYLHTLLTQCQRSSLPTLIPSFSCLLPPGELQYSLIAGHMASVTALAEGRGHVVVTCFNDGTLMLWDVEMNCAVRTLAQGARTSAADSVILCLDDSLVVLISGHCLQVREMASGRLVYSESDSLDVPMVTSTSDGQLLVAFYDGSQVMKVFDLTASCKLLYCTNITLECDPIHKDQSILLSRNSIKDYVLFAHRTGREASVFSARKGTVLAVLKTQSLSASVEAVEITSQYLLLFCRYPYKRQSEIIHIELYSSSTFQYQRSILGCGQDCIFQVTVTRNGSHAVAFCPSPRSHTTDIISWNLETEDHKHLARFPGLITQGVCFDLRFCVGFCHGERFLRRWNLASRINDTTLTYNVHKVQSDGIREIIPMDRFPRYVVCRSLRPGTVRVWNVARPHLAGRPVRVEHGLFSCGDVVLARNLKLYILTDRGMATFTDTPTPVYQTLLVYDLVKRSYMKKQTGLFIVPCPQDDYTMLGGQILLGLSETRDHIILWDLDSGYIKGRIKPSHKESLLSTTPVNKQDFELTSSEETTALIMPWDRRRETYAAKRRRLEREARREKEEQLRLDGEKYNSVDQYLLSGDQQVVVCSYFAHHLNVFSISSQEHLHTLEDRSSQLSLRIAALTRTGSHLILTNYSETQRTSYLTLWDLKKGVIKKRLKNEPGISCVAMTNDADRVAFGITGINKLKVWDPFRKKHKMISGYRNLKIGDVAQLFLIEEGAKAVLLAGELSVWDLDVGTVLSTFTPDSTIQCISRLDENCSIVLLGFADQSTLISMRLSNEETKSTMSTQEDLFGESSSSEEEDK
ncbi:uncharacterized protein LOC114801979 isoform X2 [Denticeps clupeoides]|uniref:uncharacterized protein LOC114801979 isoform X2 n=1 Tax=Denticeps clupeoides TaxID=299321 RepID=UPI0010A4F5B8|nr:uncharacterized protein LOC114801979 isoform X2 [Denticeps clupeoides]